MDQTVMPLQPEADHAHNPAPTLDIIPKNLLERVWPMAVPLIQQIVDRSSGEWSLRGIAMRLARDEWQLWVVWDGDVKAVVATELYLTDDGAKRCNIRFCAGVDSYRWLHLLDVIEGWARAKGADRITLYGRKGWARKLPDYKLLQLQLEKELI